MGANMAKSGIFDDKLCREAAKQEIIRRYFRYYRERIEGIETQQTLDRMEEIMKEVKVKLEDRKVVKAARKAAAEKGKGFNNVFCGAAIEIKDGKIITGKNSPLLHAESAAILNSIKEIANIPDDIDLISPEVIKVITNMKKDLLKHLERETQALVTRLKSNLS